MAHWLRPADLGYESIWFGCHLLSAIFGDSDAIPWNFRPAVVYRGALGTRQQGKQLVSNVPMENEDYAPPSLPGSTAR